MMKYLFAAIMLLLAAGVWLLTFAGTAAACNVPNPNLTALPPNLVDGCPLPAVTANKFVAVNNPTPAGKVNLGTGLVNSAFGTNYGLGVGVSGLNSIIGQTTNNDPLNTTAFPAGVSGYGYIPSAINGGANGNQAFGVYGLGELYIGGGGVALGAEFTGRNFSGNNPDTNIPPNTGIGTTTSVVTGANVTCGVAPPAKDCSIGLFVGNENGLYTSPVFNTGMLLQLFRQTGLWISGQTSGTQTSARIDNNGNGINLQLDTNLAMTAQNTVIAVQDSVGGSHFSVKQIGDISSTGKLEFSQTSRPVLGSNCNGAGSNINKSTDQAGIITTPTAGSTGGACTITFAGASPFQNIPSCVVSLEASAGAFISAKSTTAITVGGLSSSAAQTFDYHCLDQQ